MLDLVRRDVEVFAGSPGNPLHLLGALAASGCQALLVYRLGRWIRGAVGLPARWIPALALSIPYLLLAGWVRLAYDIRLELSADLGPGLRVFHFGGIRLRDCRLGARCVVHQEVRIEPAEEGGPGPCIGDRVWIGPHARIVGPIRIGDGATVAALALVVHDVAPGSLVGGAPARAIQARYDNSGFL